MRNKYIKHFTSRLVITAFFALLQIITFIILVVALSSYAIPIYTVLTAISVIVVIFIINEDRNPAYQLIWSVIILSFPIFGGLMYLAASLQSTTYFFKKKHSSTRSEVAKHIVSSDEALSEFRNSYPSMASHARYLLEHGNSPIYKNTSAQYFPSGEAKFARLKEELCKAEKFIFLEYFIIQEGIMWDSVLKILIEKAKSGVDVRIIWDGMGSMSTLPKNYDKILRKLGIKVTVFNPFVPLASIIQNNRDHRKIVVIDGHTAFTGGINLADEYINAYERFGHWKDAGVMLKGDAAARFPLMFLENWYIKNPVDSNLAALAALPPSIHENEASGWAQPYSDSPLDNELIGEAVYLDIIAKATDYVYIMTPYLIPDNELMSAMCLAAKSGIDVRIITPHKPDKWYAFQVTRSFYGRLINAGVRIYEYTPGFVHSKVAVSDDRAATVGSVNLDYRSLYLHFECGTMIYDCPAIADIKKDFLDTFAVSQEITAEKYKKLRGRHGLIMSLLRFFAPLL